MSTPPLRPPRPPRTAPRPKTRGRPRRAPRPEPRPEPRRESRRVRYDLYAAGAACALFALAALVGWSAYDPRETLRVPWPPLLARWLPHAGPGTPAALVLAALTVAYGPVLARRLRWRPLLAASWAAALAWTWSLALVDGWRRGAAGQLTSKHEYLRSVGEVHGLGEFLSTFTDRILLQSPGNWPAHVAGHPPGAVLTFAGLDRIGLAGGGWAAAWCVTTGTSAVVAVLVALRALGAERAARRAAPFLVLSPAAVWVGVSADGYFAAVAAWGLALLALSATGAVRAPRAAALGAGLLLGWALYLSYGLVLLAPLAAAVLVAARTARPVPYVLLGIAPWAVAFTAGGFWWYAGYTTLVERYHQGAGGVRPYAYYVWANLAAQVAVVGPATAAGLRRAAALGRGGAARVAGAGVPVAPAVLLAGALCAVLAADLSGMSKAETERIWLPFTLWLLPAAALLPARHHRRWLAAQAAVALAVNHLLITGW
ncbi:hypothetical protein CUT44_04120 [Streptomyces carminius]|uniref:Integral membrane protein n=1 Tax=Streptomyces carminius TaxID=2665496 RepID=A0A2M8M672_9ACTN|nr:hypothetical protein CUT44_04120 [Streptomyces carminius]